MSVILRKAQEVKVRGRKVKPLCEAPFYRGEKHSAGYAVMRDGVQQYLCWEHLTEPQRTAARELNARGLGEVEVGG